MSCLDARPYDVVVFLLDDLRGDQLPLLVETLSRLDGISVGFERAYASTPLCSPTRASLLSGGWPAHQTGVLGNVPPHGGATIFADGRTLATRLQEQGYTTALIGKYMNDYEALGAYVPPGWSVWAATVGEQPWNDYDVVEGSSGAEAASVGVLEHHTRYLTDWQTARALRVLEEEGGEAPLFLLLSFLAPHDPHTPAAEDAGSFADFTYRDRAWEEADVSDKPAWVQALPLLDEDGIAAADAVIRERQETLAAVDRGMAAVIDAVRAAGRAEDTVFVIGSDNGLHWREHRLDAKGDAYEESARVPLLVAHPALGGGSSQALVSISLDLAATVQDLAGLTLEGEGLSLLPALCEGEDPGREALLLQAWRGDSPAWSGLVTADDKVVELATGELEYYDLALDPYEEESLHADPARSERMEELLALLAEQRGLTVVLSALPEATVGEPYAASLQSWGGEEPLRWAVAGGALPAGLSLDADGRISGTPAEPGAVTLRVSVTDSGSSPLHGGPQSASDVITLTVNPAETAETGAKEPGGCGCALGGAGPEAGPLLALLLCALLRRRSAQPPTVAAQARRISASSRSLPRITRVERSGSSPSPGPSSSHCQTACTTTGRA